jgi:hypothetical protein
VLAVAVMGELAADTVRLLAYLLPGFVAGWLFYGITSHPKPSQFERMVQALIFTFVIQAFIPVVRWVLFLIGNLIDLGIWDRDSELVTSLFLAVLLGGAIAYFTNTDVLHKVLRHFRLTSRTSHPSEWYCAFSDHVTYVILHMKNGRRLYGWPKEWPIDPQNGQFYIQVPSWIDDGGVAIDLPELDGVLVQATDVEWVEFMRH